MFFKNYYLRSLTLCSALFGLSFALLTNLAPLHGLTKDKTVPRPTLARENMSRQISKSFTTAAKTAMPAVVSIKAQLSPKKLPKDAGDMWDEPMDPFQDDFLRRFFRMPPMPRQERRAPAQIAQGSGFSVSKDGYILTNNHVVQYADKVTVTFNDGKEYQAKLIGADSSTDIALLKIDATDVPYVELGDSNNLEIGEWVIAVGNPLGLQASLTVGVVSAVGRNDLDIARVEEFIQTDAAINRGNSGGPLLNLDGEVIGMNTAIASNTGGYMGIGFAIPSNLLKSVMDQLLKNGKVVRGFLGVTLQKVDSDIAQAFGLDKAEGALVTDFIKGGPADAAGIKPGDIILKVNNQKIDNVGSLRNAIALMQPGDSATVLVRRGDNTMKLQVLIAAHPENEVTALEVQNSLGILVQELTPDVAKQFGYADDKGVIIKYIGPNSIAHLANLAPGQLIMSVNRIPITTPDEFYKVLQDNAGKQQVLLYVKAGQAVRFVTLPLSSE